MTAPTTTPVTPDMLVTCIKVKHPEAALDMWVFVTDIEPIWVQDSMDLICTGLNVTGQQCGHDGSILAGTDYRIEFSIINGETLEAL